MVTPLVNHLPNVEPKNPDNNPPISGDVRAIKLSSTNFYSFSCFNSWTLIVFLFL